MLGAAVRTGPKKQPHALLLDEAKELWQIARAGLEIKSSLGYLVLIPENVSGDGVQAHRLRHLDTVPPILFRNAAGMNLARAHLKRFPVEQEIIRAKGEDMLGLAGGCGNGGTKNERTAEGDVEKCFNKWAKDEFIYARA